MNDNFVSTRGGCCCVFGRKYEGYCCNQKKLLFFSRVTLKLLEGTLAADALIIARSGFHQVNREGSIPGLFALNSIKAVSSWYFCCGHRRYQLSPHTITFNIILCDKPILAVWTINRSQLWEMKTPLSICVVILAITLIIAPFCFAVPSKEIGLSADEAVQKDISRICFPWEVTCSTCQKRVSYPCSCGFKPVACHHHDGNSHCHRVWHCERCWKSVSYKCNCHCY